VRGLECGMVFFECVGWNRMLLWYSDLPVCFEMA
jgi:hypothetical protein